MVKVGETAILKVSNEEVFVLAINAGAIRVTGPTTFTTGPEVAIVRRPTGTQDGVKHLVEEFLLMELESKDERLDRELAERNMLRKKMGLDDTPNVELASEQIN